MVDTLVKASKYLGTVFYSIYCGGGLGCIEYNRGSKLRLTLLPENVLRTSIGKRDALANKHGPIFHSSNRFAFDELAGSSSVCASMLEANTLRRLSKRAVMLGTYPTWSQMVTLHSTRLAVWVVYVY